MPPIKIGIVGLSKEGWASQVLAPPLFQQPLSEKYSLTAVSTRSEASANESAKKYSELAGRQVTPYYGDTSQISQDPDVELVAVAVTCPAHRQALLPAIAAGKDVFVEWPAGNGLKEATEIAQAAREKGVRTMVGTQGRQSPTIRKLKELVASGKIGKVMSTHFVGLSPREVWYWGPRINERNAYTADANGGASLLRVVVGHFLDYFTFVLGDFASIVATTVTQYPTATLVDSDHKPVGKTVPVTVADHIAFTGMLESGAMASVTWRCGYEASPGRRYMAWEIDGEDGVIRIENDTPRGAFVTSVEPKMYLNGELVSIEGDDVPNNSGRAWLEFAKGANGSYPTYEDAVRVHRHIDAISRSAEGGERISLK